MRSRNYADFLQDKLSDAVGLALNGDITLDPSIYYPHQRDLVRWALRRGRAAIFADTGLGKTRMELAWAFEVYRQTSGNVLILAPLAVAEQTTEEGERIGVDIAHVRDGSEVKPGLSITNYDRLHRFDPSQFDGVVLDESSIIKHHDTRTLARLLEAFSDTPYRLCATATPAPNDWAELGTHAEFLGIRTRVEMLSEFFVHDGGETQVWRLKGHAREAFWRWVASWGAMIRSPEDLGHDGSMYELPPLRVRETIVPSPGRPDDGLFTNLAQTLSERRQARKESLDARVNACAERANMDRQPWIVWCELNAESDALVRAIPDAVEIRGSDPIEHKERALHRFAHGDVRVLVTKPSIAGWGLNWQHCRRVAFVGVSDSYEAYYQAVRRCWRFGQTQPVDVWLYASEREGAVYNNLKRKEASAREMQEALLSETRLAVQESVLGWKRESNEYTADTTMQMPRFLRKNRVAA